jgi:hypothetical protein
VSRLPFAALTLAVLALVAPAAASAAPQIGRCAPGAELVAFSDAFDKTTFLGPDVGGLSALALRRADSTARARGLADNQGTTPARFYDLALRRPGRSLDPGITWVTRRTRPDGTPYTGHDFDGEGLGLGGRDLYAALERPLAPDGIAADGGARLRLLHHRRGAGGAYAVAGQLGYVADPGLGVAEVQVVASLADPGVAFVTRRLLVDLGDCPSGGAALRGEPTLLARALYRADAYQPGPPSGATGVAPANGRTPPFPGQPIPGISGAVANDDGTFWGQPDNGFGSKENSADFLLRIYRFKPDWRTRRDGGGRLAVERYVSLRDPDRKVPFPIVNETTEERLLTGADFDIESIQRGKDGSFWIGDEFGPWVLHVSADGKVVEPPVGLPMKSPQNPTLEPGEMPTVRASRGFEAMAMSTDGRTLYPILEGSLTTDLDPTLRRVYEFDVGRRAYTGRSWRLHASSDTGLIGDAQIVNDRRILYIDRDDLQGEAARVKQVRAVDLEATPQADGALPTGLVLDALRIRDPDGISAATGAAGIGDPFAFPIQSFETIVLVGGEKLLIANDNNYPGSNGRVPGTPDDLEAEVLRVPGLE